jgi:predicted nuclease of predicted toxin-antitoxin system
MKRRRQPYLKQKPILYFDENIPTLMIEHFRKGSRWKKKIKALSAVRLGNKGQPDDFHFKYCARHGYTLVTFDEDFNNDALYPFANGHMHGVIIVKETKTNVQRAERVLSNVLEFVLRTPFPKAFLLESKFIASGEGCVMRGRDANTKQIKSLQIVAGQTTMVAVRGHFSY